MSFVYIQRGDGSVIDVPEHDVESTLKRNKSWRVFQPSPVVAKPVLDNACPLCDFVAKTSSGLRLHKRKHING